VKGEHRPENESCSDEHETVPFLPSNAVANVCPTGRSVKPPREASHWFQIRRPVRCTEVWCKNV